MKMLHEGVIRKKKVKSFISKIKVLVGQKDKLKRHNRPK